MRKRLTEEQRSEVIHLYQFGGKTIAQIASHMGVHHSSVSYWLKDIVRKVPVQHKPKGYVLKYADYLEKEELNRIQKRLECKHPQTHLVVICLDCKEHLEQTKTHDAMVRIDFI